MQSSATTIQSSCSGTALVPEFIRLRGPPKRPNPVPICRDFREWRDPDSNRGHHDFQWSQGLRGGAVGCLGRRFWADYGRRLGIAWAGTRRARGASGTPLRRGLVVAVVVVELCLAGSG